MTTKEQIYNGLENEVRDLNDKVSNLKIYNLKNAMKRGGINTVYALHKAAPYFLAMVVASSTFPMLSSKKPFQKDPVIEKAFVQNIDTTTGYHYQKRSFDERFDTNSLEYTTGWEIGENNLYTRTLITYEINKSIDLADLDSLLSKTDQELRESLHVTNIEIISKSELTPEDEIFMEPAVIVTRSFRSDDMTYEREENFGEDLWTSFLYIAYVAIIGFGLSAIRKTIIKRKVEDKLAKIKNRYRRIEDYELDELKELLLIKKENLKLLTDPDETFDSPEPRRAR